MPKRITDTMSHAPNKFIWRLDREPRHTDSAVAYDPSRNARMIAQGDREILLGLPEAEYQRELFGALDTDALFALLDGPFLLLVDGQAIQRILIERGAWDASRVGETSTFLDCKCSVCNPERAAKTAETMARIEEVLTNTLTRSAA